MNKYERLKADLEQQGRGTMKCFGPSMKPILADACLNTYEVRTSYEVGDIVFCKVKGRYIDAHKITQKAADGRYLISNNHGHDNGWTRSIFGKVVESRDNHGNVKTFS